MEPRDETTDPVPAAPADAGVPEPEVGITRVEPLHLLANAARERLRGEGFDDDEIDEWARAFAATHSSGTVDELVAWIRRREDQAGIT